jgi:hypothetical protein
MSSESTLSLRSFVSLVRGTTYKGELVGQPGPVLLGLASIQPDGGFGEAPSRPTVASPRPRSRWAPATSTFL